MYHIAFVKRAAFITTFMTALVISPIAMAASDHLTIGTRVSPSNLDPQMSALSTDIGYYRHIFDALYQVGPQLDLYPGLAVSEKFVDDLTWEFELRPGVKFHDGTDFDANDVIFTLNRLRTGDLPGNDGLTRENMKPIVSVEAIGTHGLRIKTSTPTPDLLTRLAEVQILSDSIDPKATTENFNTGVAAIGTGPFKLKEWRRGEELGLVRNENYWGEPAAFSSVSFKTMTADAARVAALQAGDVDLIDFVPPLDAARLRKTDGIELFTAPSGRVVFLQVDAVSNAAVQVTDKDGKPITDRNPLADIRVRKALKLGINKDLIVEKVMDGLAFPATQGVPEGFGGYNAEIPMTKHSPDAAKVLLTEAGYPDGFGLTLTCPNDRYVNDAQICQAIGQFWSQIGVATKVETMPKAVYFDKLLEKSFSAYMLAWGNDAGNSISLLTSVISTKNDAAGRGSWNASYSNPTLDGVIDRAVVILDADKRNAALAEAMAIAVEDVALIPLHSAAVIVAARSGLKYTPMANETLMAARVSQ